MERLLAVSEGLNSVETHFSLYPPVSQLSFQKDLIVWKPVIPPPTLKSPSTVSEGLNSVETSCYLFFIITRIRVSEGLNSVETPSAEIPLDFLAAVSEGLNSVETCDYSFESILSDRVFQKDLIVWKLSTLSGLPSLIAVFQKDLIVWKLILL